MLPVPWNRHIYSPLYATVDTSSMKFVPGFERTTGEASDRSAVQEESIGQSKSRRTEFFQGAAVFVVMFATLWWLLSRDGKHEE
jgi:hypothetical protein